KTADKKFPDDPRIIGFLKAQIKSENRIKNRTQRLQEAAIVEDIRSAIELWIHNPDCHFVSLNGDLVLSSGMVKIGQKKEGLFSLNQEIKDLKARILSTEQQMIPLENDKQELIEKIEELKTKASALAEIIADREKTIEAKAKELEYIRIEEKKISLAVDLAEKEVSALDKDKQDLKGKLDEIHNQIDLLTKSEIEKKNHLAQREKDLSLLEGTNELESKKFFELRSSIDLDREKIANTKDRIHTLEERQSGIIEKLKSLEQEIKTAENQLLSLSDSITGMKKKEESLEKEIKAKEKDLLESEVDYRKVLDLQKKLEDKLEQRRTELNEKKEDRVQWEVKKAQKERDLVNLEESCWQELKKTIQEIKSEVDLNSIPDDDIEVSLEDAKDKLQKFKAVNLMAEEEYEIQKKRFDFLTQQYEDLRQSIDSTKEAIRKIDQESKTQFLNALEEVNKNFKDVFSILFEGGHAEIKLSEPDQPLESGIEIIAQPPGKRVQSLTLLSGGEKTLTSLSFFFALFRYKPTPFCLLDEVDAALDEANLGRFLNLMNKIKANIQFIIITHSFKTMEVADYIYGTTMAEPNVTSIYAVKLDKAKAVLSAVNGTPDLPLLEEKD
ncbi:MAG: chromosome segregation protein SMC, partial [Candidatus Aminicenantes bacterium]|nr:chromosome segregation protein SMC [Candidatus Aminicenantes bacterium]